MTRIPPLTFLCAAVCCLLAHPAQAAMVTFDFDTGTPALARGQSVAFLQASGGINATFSSPEGAAFSLQDEGSTQFKLTQFTGLYLYPNNILRNSLDIAFSEPLVSINISFATVDYQDNAEIPGDLELTAYDTASGSLVGTATKHGNYLGDQYPMGVLSFVSTVQGFDRVHLVVPPQPQGTTSFFVDNVTVTTTVIPPLEVSGPVSSTPLMFATQDEMIWDDRSASNAASFNLYSDSVAALPGSYGLCNRVGLPASYVLDPWIPPVGVAWFYIVTARNAFGEGTMGADSSGNPRVNGTPCP